MILLRSLNYFATRGMQCYGFPAGINNRMNDWIGVAPRVKDSGEKLQLWDDEAFKLRLMRAADRRGMSMVALFAEAGVSRFYLSRSRVGRNTNTILNFARILQIPPHELFGLRPIVLHGRGRDQDDGVSDGTT